jgi:hypothetical protein
MSGIDDDLTLFIAETADMPLVWGESDCTAWAASWVARIHGRAIRMPRWRSRAEAQALIAAAGSLEALWSPALADFGLTRRSGAPEPGDVGIIDTRVAGQVGVVFLHDRLVAWRAEPAGVRAIRPKTVIGIWALQ